MFRLVIWLAVLMLSAGPAAADPASDASAEIVKQWGAPGAIIVILGGVVLRLAYKIGKMQDARLDDQRDFAKQFVGLTNDYNVATHDIAKTTAAQSVAIEGIDAGEGAMGRGEGRARPNQRQDRRQARSHGGRRRRERDGADRDRGRHPRLEEPRPEPAARGRPVSWRAALAALFAVPSLPIHREVEEAIRRRREMSRFSARVHQAAQTSALDIINEQRPGDDTLDAWVKGRDAE